MRTREETVAGVVGGLPSPEWDSLVATRRDLHRHPELAFEEHRTAGVVADRLRRLGLAPREGVGSTGVTADPPAAPRPGGRLASCCAPTWTRSR